MINNDVYDRNDDKEDEIMASVKYNFLHEGKIDFFLKLQCRVYKKKDFKIVEFH